MSEITKGPCKVQAYRYAYSKDMKVIESNKFICKEEKCPHNNEHVKHIHFPIKIQATNTYEVAYLAYDTWLVCDYGFVNPGKLTPIFAIEDVFLKAMFPIYDSTGLREGILKKIKI